MLDDEALGWLADRIFSIDMLDIYEAPVTQQGMAHLTRMRHLVELRLKGCTSVEDNCLPLLRQIPGLELLHLGSTGITLDGIGAMDEWSTLKALYLSTDRSAEQILQHVTQLRLVLPACEIVLNHQPLESYLPEGESQP
ncbi:hypothetical protein GCM10027348_42580 [Hymenobacter tenuis]